MSLRALLDATPVASLALALMREATGRDRPFEPLRPARPARLAPRVRVGFWSLAAGAGASTAAALVAHRAGAAGSSPVLIDLDRWAPSLALRARIDAATVADALVMPGREAELLSRWAGVRFLPADPGLHAILDGRVADLVERVAGDQPAVLDLGAGADALAPETLAVLTRLVVVTGPRIAQLQAAFCAVPLLRDAPCDVRLLVVGAQEEDACSIAARLPWKLVGALPRDPYLADDAFGVRAPVLRAVDAVIRRLV